MTAWPRTARASTLAGPPSPPVTVVVLGRGNRPGEVLATGLPHDDPAPRPASRASRWVGLSSVAVLCAGVLLGVTGRGFFVETVGATLPAPLGPWDRAGASIGFDLLVQVSDCAIDSQAQRTLELHVQQGPRTGEVEVAVDGEVVPLLDRLVARTCRRPRG